MNTDNIQISDSKPTKVPVGLFDTIIRAIRNEQELKHSKKLFFVFFSLLIISCMVTPFSLTMLIKQINNSGILHFLSMITSDLGMVINSWSNFSLAVLESLPIIGIMIFVLNVALALFTIRLFLHRKQLLFKYLMRSFNHNNLLLT